MYSNPLAFIVIMLLANSLSGCSDKYSRTVVVDDSMKSRAIEELRNNLHALSGWEKVHTAEFLVWLGHKDEVRQVYLQEEAAHASEIPYRIGIWRVLAQASVDESEKQKYVTRILEAFQNIDGKDRLHAVETLGKLGVPLLKMAPEMTKEILDGALNSLCVYTMWAASIDNPAYPRQFKPRFLELTTSKNKEEMLRLQAAFSLRNLGGLSPAEWKMLATSALSEPDSSIAGIYLLTAALFNTPPDSLNSETCKGIYQKILADASSPQKGRRMETAYAVAEKGTPDDLEVLVSLLDNVNPLNNSGLKDSVAIAATPENADVRSAASYAILRIDQRFGHTVEP